jgi:hypothetical protein
MAKLCMHQHLPTAAAAAATSKTAATAAAISKEAVTAPVPTVKATQ